MHNHPQSRWIGIRCFTIPHPAQFLLLLSLVLMVGVGMAQLSPEAARTLPPAEVEAALTSSHPASYYAYASRLYAEGKRDQSVVWFYIGQLRYRFHLRSNPNLPRDGDPALMASLNSTVGQTINQWAGGSPKDWASAIGMALQWDEANDNEFTSKTQYENEWKVTREGLAGLRDEILAQAARIRAEREHRGLENR